MSTMEPSCTTLPLGNYPGMNPLALDLVRGSSRATHFFEDHFQLTPSPGDRRALADALIDSNLGWGGDVRDDVEAWARGEAGAVVAGQQVGFGGGPLYTLVKIASLMRLRREARAEGRRIVPFFWMATEDHDFDEVTRLTLELGRNVRQFRTLAEPSARFPVGRLEVPEDLRAAVSAATGLDGEGWLEPGLSLRDSFARLVASVTRGEVVLVDALLPALREYGRDLFVGMAGKFEEIQNAIRQRSARLADAGYAPQVAPARDEVYTLFYEISSNGAREPLDSAERLRELADDRPEAVSTAALMRPLLQDHVLSPEVFVGGPAEVAYYAQLGGVYDLLGVRQPQVRLRAHCLVVPERLIRSMKRHEVAPDEWLDGTDAILSRRETRRSEQLRRRVDDLGEHFARELEGIRAGILEADPSLTRSLNRTIRRIQYHLDVLERRGLRVISRSDRERTAAVERFSGFVMPGGILQDRTVGWLSFWLLWGDRLLESLIPCADPGRDQLQIVGIQ